MSLVGRDEELATVVQLYRECCRGNSRVVTLSGPVGSGKTAFLNYFAERARASGALFLYAAASRTELGFSLSTLEQLLRNAELPLGFAKQVADVLDDGVFSTVVHADRQQPVGVQDTVARRRWQTRLWEVLRDLADHQPLVIGIDDAHHTDALSQQCLLYLLRRLRSARIMVLLSESVPLTQTQPVLRGELLHEPHFRHIELKPLPPYDAAALFTERLGHDLPRELVAECHQLTGGSPVLVQALAEEHRIAGTLPKDRLVVGEAFGKAVSASHFRCDHETRLVAHGLALLGGHATTALLGKLLDLGSASIDHALNTLDAMGLINGQEFRHNVTRAAVLAAMTAEQRSNLHVRAALLLDEEGKNPAAVAAQLVAADRAPTAAMVQVLVDAAGETLANGELHPAIRFLRLARRYCDATHRPSITAALAWVEWQLDPAAASRHIPELDAAARGGEIGRSHVTKLFGYLLWHGRTEEAVDLLATLTADPGASVPGRITESDARHLRSWISHLYPGTADPAAAHDSVADHYSVISPDLRGTALLGTMHDSAQAENILIEAEQILHGSRFDDTAPISVTAALVALTYSDRLSQAAAWYEHFRDGAAARRMHTWHGLLAAIGAVINFRLGHLDAACSAAQTAFTAIPPKNWGVSIGLPLAGGVLAASAQGKLDEAADYLALPVPDAMFRSPFALHYLEARGHHHLTSGHYHAALGDFMACGDLMARWGLDTPSLVSWRTDAAQAQLGLGKHSEARRLVEKQLKDGAAGHPRVRGSALRVLAATEEPARRISRLWDAVEALQECGDRWGLALAHTDLSHAHSACNETSQARLAARRAWHLAEECGAKHVLQGLPVEVDVGAPKESGLGEDGTDLSAAELKVATLASSGHTNRQIANKLYVTVSTVEQHLTRVYRKLKVTHRHELPAQLSSSPVGVRT